MKKFALFCAVALLLSSFSVGCSSNGGSTSSWCRSGSLFPTARSKQNVQTVYTTAAATSACNPCDQAACSPCEPACQPCEPVCDPCAMSCNNVISGGIIPHPAN